MTIRVQLLVSEWCTPCRAAEEAWRQVAQRKDIAFEVLDVPGHTAGHIAYVGAGAVFCGDTLFAGSIGRFDFPTSNEADLFRSIGQKLYALPAHTKVFPGHGPPTTIGRERESNPYVRAQ
mgnify:CR=1 FL=1